jgi:uncharacterized protein (TIGR02118 family)
MIKLTVLYANGDEATFDNGYYRDKHIPLARRVFTPVSIEVERGVGVPGSEEPPPYLMICGLTFESMDALGKVLSQAADLIDDVPNFTNIASVLQISEIDA